MTRRPRTKGGGLALVAAAALAQGPGPALAQDAPRNPPAVAPAATCASLADTGGEGSAVAEASEVMGDEGAAALNFQVQNGV